MALFSDLEDVHESTHGPAIGFTSIRLMGELGATLEDGGYFTDPEPDPEPTNAVHQVIAIDGDPSVIDWSKAFAHAVNRGARVA